MKPLTADDGEAIIEQFRNRYRKTFEPGQRAALLAKTDAGTPLYLLAALEELRTLGTYEEISQRIAELPPTTHELFAWILDRLENDDGFRDASGRRVGRELVSRFGALLGASRHGLSQRELADLLDAGDQQGNVAALLHLLRPYLMRRGELLDFYHSQFRQAVQTEFLSADTDQYPEWDKDLVRIVLGQITAEQALKGLETNGTHNPILAAVGMPAPAIKRRCQAFFYEGALMMWLSPDSEFRKYLREAILTGDFGCLEFHLGDGPSGASH